MNKASSCLMRLPYRYLSILLVLLFLVSGCSSLKGLFHGAEEQPLPPPQANPKQLITEGMRYYNVGNYYKALQSFDKILDDYPFSQEAMLAELKAADANYYNRSFVEAKLLYQKFEERHPTNEAIPYVLFQSGMCDFERTDRLDRDTSGAKDAIRTFSRLLRTFPDSPYTKEAQARIEASRDFLVHHEYQVAVFYTRTKKYDQATHRLKYLIAMYPDAEIIPMAKALLKRIEEGNPPRWGLSKWLPNALKSWQ